MKKIVLMLLLFLCSDSLLAQVNVERYPKDFKKMHVSEVCKIEDGAIAVVMDLEIPMFSVPLQKYLSKKMFNSEQVSLPGAVNMFLQNHSVNEEKGVKHLSSDTLIYNLYCISYCPAKYVTLFIEYPNLERMKTVGKDVCEIKKETLSIIYDISNENTLVYDDIFTNNYVDLYTGNISKRDYLFELDEDYLSYGSTDSFVRLPLCQLIDYLTPQFKQLVDWPRVDARADSLQLHGNDVQVAQQRRVMDMGQEQARRLEEIEHRYNEYISKKQRDHEAMFESYLADKKSYKNIHLYMHDGACLVSSLNKDITQLTPEDIALLEKKGKQVLPEIDVMKEWLLQQDGQLVADSIYYIVTPESLPERVTMDSLMQYIDQYASSTQYGFYVRIDKELREYMRTRLSLKHDTINATVMFFVNKDGSLVCPVIKEGNDIEVNKEIMVILRKFKKKLKPYIANGEPVRACMSCTFSYVKRTIPALAMPRSSVRRY